MKQWQYTQNPFLNATEGSFRAAMAMSTYHDSALYAHRSDPFILGLYTPYHLLHVDYTTLFENSLAQGGLQQGETLNVHQLLLLLSNSKIQSWDIAIQVIYKQNTAHYKSLLPHRRQPFQKGPHAGRIHSVQALSTAIGTDTALASVKTEVSNFFAELSTAELNQKSSLSTTKTISSDLETARKALSYAMFGNYGAMIHRSPSTPTVVEKYFDLPTIRRSQQVEFTGHVASGKVYTIVKHTFGVDDQVKLINQGNTTLDFYLAATRDAQPGTKMVSLASGQQTVLASALGNLTDPYLIVRNPDALLLGEFVVELL